MIDSIDLMEAWVGVDSRPVTCRGRLVVFYHQHPSGMIYANLSSLC